MYTSSRTEWVRILLALAGFACALFLPWWTVIVCMLALAVRYPAWEVMLLGLFMDLLWLPAEGASLPLFTIFGIAVVWLASPLRRQLLL